MELVYCSIQLFILNKSDVKFVHSKPAIHQQGFEILNNFELSKFLKLSQGQLPSNLPFKKKNDLFIF